MAIANTNNLRGNLPASTINSFSADAKEFTINATATGASIPIIYGTTTVNGMIAAYQPDGGNDIYLVIWGYGEVKSITPFIDGEAIGEDIDHRNYRGVTYQKADNWVESAITAYADTLILEKPAGEIGIAHSVFKIDPADVGNEPPSFSAIVEGQLCPNPGATHDGDPFKDETGHSIHFQDASPSSATDDSLNAHTVTLHGDAETTSTGLECDGNGDFASIANHTSLIPDTELFEIEGRCTPTDVGAGDHFIYSIGSIAGGDACISIYRNADDLVLSLSSNGTSWDIYNGEVVKAGAFSAGVELDFKVCRYGGRYLTWVDGGRADSKKSSSTLFSSTARVEIGAEGGVAGTCWHGSILCSRSVKGAVRTNFRHDISNAPFADSGTFTAGNEFTDNPALCMGELAANPYYGLGVSTVDGLAEARDWCDELVGGSLIRSRLSLAISTPKKTEDWLDLIGEYAECFSMPDGADTYALVPDQPAINDPSGEEFASNPTFTPESTVSPEADDSWTVTNGWVWNAALDGFYIHLPESPNTEAEIAQQVVPDYGEAHIARVDIVVMPAGSVDLVLDGVVLKTITEVGEHSVEVVPTESSPNPIFKAVYSGENQCWITRISLTRKYWLETKFIKDSIRIEGMTNADTPNKINIRHKVASSSSPNWEEKTASYTLPGVAAGDVPLIEATVSMPGVYRADEAINKAQTRALKLQNRVRVTWQTTDSGLAYRKGGLVQLVQPNKGIDLPVRLFQHSRIAAGRYQATGFMYADSNYPNNLPEGTGVVPEHAITLLAPGSAVPSGWAEWTDANGKYIKICDPTASPEEAPGDLAGSATFAGWTSTTEDGGEHAPESGTGFKYRLVTPPTGGQTNYRDDDATEPAHTHSFSTGVITPDPRRRENILIQKTSSGSATVPKEAMVFGLNNLAIANLVRTVAYQNRLLQAAAANANDGVSSQSVSFTSGSTDDSHDHHSIGSSGNTGVDFSNNMEGPPTTGGGPHTHDYALALSLNIKQYKLALYEATDDFTVRPGVIFLWPQALTGSPEPIPAGWVHCDGTGATPALPGYHVAIAANGEEGDTSGDNTLSITGVGSAVSHSHEGSSAIENIDPRTFYHKNEWAHDHNIDESGDWQPESYCLHAIMYTG